MSILHVCDMHMCLHCVYVVYVYVYVMSIYVYIFQLVQSFFLVSWQKECVLQCAAAFGILLHTESHCKTLQDTATHCNILQHTATHCNTLQHTATHCNTLQHTATHCSSCLQHCDVGGERGCISYGVATISRLPKNIGLF